ncbi:STAS domain-containing protein [Cerasicoccus maritimus]|uniref:STAS domain-containing protein n=1 Tax=Cerasicoccus maritimus TaxID=490089 RepID=UPI0028526E90|nr:STAS domain-containing protein [Cerasicoccus maritimus]
MELKVIRADDEISHIALIGRMDHAGASAVELKFLAATASRQKPTMVDMSEVTFVVSLGIRMLLGAAKSLKANDCGMALVNVQPLVAETLRLAKLDEVFILADSEEDALAKLGV